jgi:hypothetical protein
MPEQMFHDAAPADAGAPVADIVAIKETAERMANGDLPNDADPTRVLAGMIQHLAEAIERMSAQALPPDAPLAQAPPD